jgi:AhpD family alkylhydroperoxidase
MILPEEVQSKLNELNNVVYNPKLLDPKTRELIAIANSLMINCEHCMQHHYAKAKEAGVSDEEIAEAVAITVSVAAGKRLVKAREVLAKLMN